MAVPQYPLEIWAKEDYHLPNADNPNKIRPIDDLWRKGYDKGQRPNAEGWNYMWYMQTTWLDHIYSEQIPGLNDKFLQKSLNLSDVPDKAAALANLGAYNKAESDQRFVNVEGDTMTGPLTVPRINFPASATDKAWIETISPKDDKTFFDFSIADNYGDKNGANNNVDVMRWRFTPTGGLPTFSMLELHADTSNSAYMELAGKFWARDIYSNTNLTCNGTVSGQTGTFSGNVVGNYLQSRSTIDIVGVGTQATYTSNGDVFGPAWNVSGNLSLKNYIDTRATTSAGLGQGSGWFKDDKTGYIHQWAVGRWRLYGDEGFESVNFPIPFPNECLSVNCGTQLQAEDGYTDIWGQAVSWNRTSTRVVGQWTGGENAWNTAVRVIVWAVGR